MKTLSDVLRAADPLAWETRSPEARAATRSAVLHGPCEPRYEVRYKSRSRTLALALAASIGVVAAA